MKIDELLEKATPPSAKPPTSESIRNVIAGKRRRRQGAITAAASGLMIVAGLSLVNRTNDGQVDAILDLPATTAQQDTTTFAPVTSQGTTTSTAVPLTPSQARTFLAPPEQQQLRFLQDNQLAWSVAQNDGLSNTFMVSRESVADGTVEVYYLDYIGIEITNGPEEFTEGFTDVEVDGSTVRVGSDPQRDSVKAFREWEPGVIVVVGWGLTNDEALAIALAADVQNGVLTIDADQIPADLVLEAAAVPTSSDYSSSLTWALTEDSEATLSATPGSVAQAALESSWLTERTAVSVRDTEGVFASAVADQDDPRLMWSEDGYRYSLTSSNQDVSALIEIAEALEPIDQPEMVSRLGPDYPSNQAATIARWLEDNPLPPSWDPAALIHSIPGWPQQVASFTQQYISCAWGVEWLEAAQSGDPRRQTAAFDVLADRLNWSVVQAEIEAAQQQLSPDAAEEYESFWPLVFAEQAESLASATTSAEIERIGGEISCAFSKP